MATMNKQTNLNEIGFGRLTTNTINLTTKLRMNIQKKLPGPHSSKGASFLHATLCTLSFLTCCVLSPHS